MLDTIIRGGAVVDGAGTPPRHADLGIADGRVVTIGDVDDLASRTVDAGGLVVAPGFIDIHTHYDAQLSWDPFATPSPLHGVTTVIGGNCGFSIAPLGSPDDADYVMRMMAVVEGIPLETLRAGTSWDWRSFGEWLDRFEGRLGVNAGFLVGHSALRRTAMGPDATRREATAEQLQTMISLLHQAFEAGALGFSSSRDAAHTDGDGSSVPSNAASVEELVALAGVARDHEGTTLEFIPTIGRIPPDRMNLMADMSLAADRPLNWNLLGSMSPVEIYEQQLEASDVASRRGARVVALTIPDLLRIRANSLLDNQREFAEVSALPERDRRAALADPAVRDRLRRSLARAAERGIETIGRWDLIEVAEGRSALTEPYAGWTIERIASSRGVDPIDVLLDVVLPEQLPLTMVLPSLVPSLGRSDEGWKARVAIWQDERVVLGGSDAGAHLDLLCHANYPTVVLSEVVRQRQLLSIEAAVRLMTDVPARLYGLKDRGRIALGGYADLVLLDPSTVASQPPIARFDLPAGGERLFADSQGIARVLVGGRDVVVEGALTGDLVGSVLRSGRDTETVTLSG
jgi:N-acyl-D-aspartate/D-glutamate deacylase